MLIKRINQTQIYHSFLGPFVTAILGPRRVGKTTLVTQFIQEQTKQAWVQLNMDSWEERYRVENQELRRLIQEQSKLQLGGKTKIWVSIDEAQKCPALFEQIKILYDQYKDQNAIKFILTGSGFLSLHQMSSESLAGRIELHHLREFNLQETVSLKENVDLPRENFLRLVSINPVSDSLSHYIESRAPFRQLIESSLSEQLVWGGLPEVVESSDPSRKRSYLSNYLQTYFEKDIRAITTITDLSLFRKLMEITAEQTGSIKDDQSILDALGCSRDTLKKYRGFLAATLIYREVYPFIGSTLKRLVKSPKGYLQDNGIISYLSGIDDISILEKTGLIGHRFENWLLKELEIWLDGETKHSEIYYWRTSAGVEVDFVVERKPDVFPFEITYSTRIQAKKIKNLTTFMQDEPQAKLGFYVYMGEFKYDTKNKICFLPAWTLG